MPRHTRHYGVGKLRVSNARYKYAQKFQKNKSILRGWLDTLLEIVGGPDIRTQQLGCLEILSSSFDLIFTEASGQQSRQPLRGHSCHRDLDPKVSNDVLVARVEALVVQYI